MQPRTYGPAKRSSRLLDCFKTLLVGTLLTMAVSVCGVALGIALYNENLPFAFPAAYGPPVIGAAWTIVRVIKVWRRN